MKFYTEVLALKLLEHYGEHRTAVAIVVSSTALTLLLLPMLYVAFEGKGTLRNRHPHERFMKKRKNSMRSVELRISLQ